MDIIRRNTDYGLRAAIVLAEHYDRMVPARRISDLEQIPYPLTCKIMQKFHRAGLVKSIMGPRGGFKLNKDPEKISLIQLMEILQGPAVPEQVFVKA